MGEPKPAVYEIYGLNSKHPVVNGAKFSQLEIYSYEQEKVHSSYILRRKAEKVS